MSSRDNIAQFLQGNIKAGDKVIVNGTHIATVNRVLPTQIVLQNGSKFRRSNGEEVGGSQDRWSRGNYLLEPTEENLSLVREHQREQRYKIKLSKVYKLPFDKLSEQQLDILLQMFGVDN